MTFPFYAVLYTRRAGELFNKPDHLYERFERALLPGERVVHMVHRDHKEVFHDKDSPYTPETSWNNLIRLLHKELAERIRKSLRSVHAELGTVGIAISPDRLARELPILLANGAMWALEKAGSSNSERMRANDVARQMLMLEVALRGTKLSPFASPALDALHCGINWTGETEDGDAIAVILR